VWLVTETTKVVGDAFVEDDFSDRGWRFVLESHREPGPYSFKSRENRNPGDG